MEEGDGCGGGAQRASGGRGSNWKDIAFIL